MNRADSDPATNSDSLAGSAESLPLRRFASAIYEGRVRHRRYEPHAHAFDYRLCMLYVDLAEIDTLFAKRWLWSVDRRNVAEFRRTDYFGDASQPIDVAVRDRIEAETGARPTGPIRMLSHLRYFGHCFNPVSFYYCFAADGVALETVLAQITNTPWKERHAYVLPVAAARRQGSAFSWQLDKAFHVSPFLPMQCRYEWRFTVPGDALRVHMDVSQSRESAPLARAFDATLVLQRREFTATNLARALLHHPLMTLRVVVAIHWQALRIWMRGNPVYDHPKLAPGDHSTMLRASANPEPSPYHSQTKDRS